MTASTIINITVVGGKLVVQDPETNMSATVTWKELSHVIDPGRLLEYRLDCIVALLDTVDTSFTRAVTVSPEANVLIEKAKEAALQRYTNSVTEPPLSKC